MGPTGGDERLRTLRRRLMCVYAFRCEPTRQDGTPAVAVDTWHVVGDARPTDRVGRASAPQALEEVVSVFDGVTMFVDSASSWRPSVFVEIHAAYEVAAETREFQRDSLGHFQGRAVEPDAAATRADLEWLRSLAIIGRFPTGDRLAAANVPGTSPMIYRLAFEELVAGYLSPDTRMPVAVDLPSYLEMVLDDPIDHLIYDWRYNDQDGRQYCARELTAVRERDGV